MAKRTVIAPDEELLVQGKLTITGNVTQVETTQTVNRLDSDELVINADGDAVTAKILLRGASSNATLSFNSTTGNLEISQPITVPSGTTITATFIGDLTGNVTGDVTGDTNGTHTGAVVGTTVSASSGFTGNLTGDVTGNVTGDVTGQVSDISNHNTDDLTQGSSNLYFTDALARAAISSVDNGGDGSLTYNSTSGVITYTGPDQDEANARVLAASGQVRSLVSANDTGGDGSLTYDNSTGVFEYTGPSAADVRAHFSATSPITISSGVIAINNPITEDFVFANNVEVQGNLIVGPDAITDVHTSFYVNTNGALSFSHNATGAYYAVVSGDGIDLSANSVAVDSTVVRTNTAGTQTISKDTTFSGQLIVPTLTVPSNPSGNAYVAGDLGGTTKAASTAYVEAAINALVGSAPGTLDTLNEIAAAINDNASIGAQVVTNTNDIATLESRNLTAGSGLTGGGDLTADRTFNIGQSTGITVNADSIQTNDGEIVHDNLSGFVADEHVDHSSVTLTAGDGLSGGGDITTSRSFDVDSTVVRTTGNQSLADTKTFTGELIVPGSSATANGAIYYDNSTSEAFIYVGGTARKITPAVDAGDVEDVGAGEVNVYAGTRISGNTTFHGIKSISSGTYTAVSEAANVITVDGDVSAIRGAFSGTDNGGLGSFSYNSSTGDFLYTGPSNNDIRTLISGTGLISYNNSTGEISTSADNYGSWKFTTPTTGNVDISSNELLTFSAGTGIGISHSGSTITITNTNAADITGVTAGAGLTGGGTGGTVTLDAVGGYGVTVNADNIELSNSDVRGLFSAGGDLSYNSGTGQFSFTERTDSEVRGLVSASGDLSYNSTTGVFSFTERTDAEVRGLISGSTGITYNSSTGEIALSDTGYISGVTAGSGLTGGGTDGNVTLSIDYENLSGNLIPSTDSTYDLGNSTVRWAEGWFDNLYVPDVAPGATTSISAASDLNIKSQGILDYTSLSTNTKGTDVNISGGATETTNINNFPDFGGIGGDVNIKGGFGLVSSGNINIGASTTQYVNIVNNRWPTTTGTSGQVLTVGASGVTSWQTPTVGDITAVTAGTDLTGGGTSGAVTLNVTSASTNTASTIVKRDSSGNFAAGVITATATAARYADLAEKYTTDADYEPGTVVVFGGVKEVTTTTQPNDHRVAGVISTDPAYMMNTEAEGQYVALRGRVPCKVIGPVRKGDVLITSNVPGYAVASDQPHFVSASCIVGKSLENFEGTEGVIEVVV